MPDITGEQLIQAVRDIAQDRPDYVYVSREGCSYRPNAYNPTTGCIIGEALEMLQIPIPDNALELTIDQLLPKLPVTYSVTEETWLTNVQQEQDNGIIWSIAVSIADRLHQF